MKGQTGATQQSLKSVVQQRSGATASAASRGVADILTSLREQLAAHGARGIIGLSRKFRIMDDDGSKALSLAEFKKAMQECAMNLNDAECRLLFNHFDADSNGSIDFEEFIQGVRDPLTDRRLKLVHMAFDRLDKEHKGHVLPEDLIGTYDASKHPDVLSGRKTPNVVLQEFLDTFDVGGEKDGKVTRQEFVNYYTNLGASIDNEDYFELMIRNAWHISGGEGWSANSANRRVLVTDAAGNESVVEIKDDLGLKADDKHGMMQRLKAQGTDATSVFTFGSADNTDSAASGRRKFGNAKLNSSIEAGVLPGTGGTSYVKKGDSAPAPKRSKSPARVPPVGVQSIVARLKGELATRGARGFVGLQRKFRIMDDDGNHQLDRSEFSKAMREMNMGLVDADCRMLFDYFDKDGSGTISFEEFIQGVRNPLNERRRNLVTQAFNIIDIDGNGIVDAAEIAQKYDASKHPEVLAGRMTAEQVFLEFLDTFDVGGEKDGKVTRQEFENYYSNIGASIDNDDYFELMMRNAWHISGGEGWSANSANRRVLVTNADGTQSVVEIKDDLGLKADDKHGMMQRLKAQGVNASSISLHDGMDNRTGGHAAGTASRPRTAVSAATQAKLNNSFASSSITGILGATTSNDAPTGRRPATAAAALSSDSVFAHQTQSGRVLRGERQMNTGLRSVIAKLKREIKARGGSGFLGLQRKFRIMDDDNSKSLSLGEFKKAMQECNIELRDQELREVFDFFDTNQNGSIDFEEFIQGVRDPLTDRRLALVNAAFDILDVDGNGVVDAEEVIAKYDASKHPDVIAGKKTPQQVLTEWMSTFEVGESIDGKITRQEFINYYANIGANIDNEDYFELMIRNAWHISGGEGWCANTANRRVMVTDRDGNESVVEIKNDLGLKADDKQGMMQRIKASGYHASTISLAHSIDNTEPATARRPAKKAVGNQSNNSGNVWSSVGSVANATEQKASRPVKNYPAQKSSIFIGDDSTPAKMRPDATPRSAVASVLSQLKQQLALHGARGFVGLQRKFRIIDDDGSKSISMSEFKKAMKECGLDLDEENTRLLFRYFDTDGNGSIDFEEFIQGLRGDLSERRKHMISLAFAQLDKDGNGIIEPEDIMSTYNADRHPDVLAGKRTSGEILHEFLDTFDVGGVKDGKVTRQEFENYYHNISASIDDDDYFELMMRNAWHISGGTGWSANTANRRVLVTHRDGSQSVEEIKKDLGLKAGDKQGMMQRLRDQGVSSAASLATTYGSDNRDNVGKAAPRHFQQKKLIATKSQIVLG